MKTNRILIGLSLLLMCFLSSCSKDSTTLEELQSTSRDNPKDNADGMHHHGGDNNGGEEVVYQMIHTGFLNNTSAHALEGVNNNKREEMHIASCDQSFQMTGIDALANSVINTCESLIGSICIKQNGINVNKGKQNPGRVDAGSIQRPC